jgi:hypothetical protein
MNSKRNDRKYFKAWRLKNTLLNDWGVTEEIKGEIKNS